MMRRIVWLLTFWLRKPVQWWVKTAVSPAAWRESSGLDPAVPVCFVLPVNSFVDRWVLEAVLAASGYPTPGRKVRTLPGTGEVAVLYLPSLVDPRANLEALFEQARDRDDYDLQLVPVSLFWGRNPGTETSLFRILFSHADNPGFVRKAFIVLANGRNALLHFGKPVHLREFVGQVHDYRGISRKLLRVFRVHFRRTRNATIGPSLSTLNQTVRAVLANPQVREVIAQEAADGSSIEEQRAKARKYVEEIAADYSTTTLRFFYRVLTWLWNKVYDGVNVYRIERAREAAAKGGVMYLASHRSHMDYLLLSYVLYKEGLVPPHIAAGINLNFWPMGPVLRRGGAFFLRRSFGGKKLYTAVFRAYLDVLVSRGYPISFYPEGGRSRTGRLLQPKTGMLAMLTSSYVRNAERPLTIIPVFVGYDQVMEVNSYFKELRGTQARRKESIFELLKARSILKRKYGRAYVSFGEPLEYGEYIRQQHPEWLEAPAEESPEGLPAFVQVAADTVMARINDAAVLNSTGLASLAVLATPQRAIPVDEFEHQVDTLVKLQQQAPYSTEVVLPEQSAAELVAQSEPLAGLDRIAHPWGDVIAAQGRNGVLITYTRNNVQHLFAIASLIASFFRGRQVMARADLIDAAQDLYPFMQTELHLRWPMPEVGAEIERQLDALVALGLLTADDQGMLHAPALGQPQYGALMRLGDILRETLERFALTALLLKSRLDDGAIDQQAFEQECQLMTERLAMLTGRNAPEFFDKALSRGFVATLKTKGWLRPADDGSGRLSIDARIAGMADHAMDLLGADIGQLILQVLSASRRGVAPAPTER